MEEEKVQEIVNEEVSETPQVEEVIQKKVKKSKPRCIYKQGDVVMVQKDPDATWSDESVIPSWVYSRTFFIDSIRDEEYCSLKVNETSQVTGEISWKFLIKIC